MEPRTLIEPTRAPLSRLLLGTFILAFTCATSTQAQERIRLQAQINGKPARLIFDTGADSAMLFSNAAAALGLAWTNPPTAPAPGPGRVPYGTTRPCEVSMFGLTEKMTFSVVESPPADIGIDGVLGWPDLKHNVLRLDARVGVLTFFGYPPPDPTNWETFTLQTNSDFLHLQVPRPDGKLSIIALDTGSDFGVSLAPGEWQAWRKTNGNHAVTLRSYYTPATKIVVTEEAWADQLSIGPLHLTQVPVSVANVSDVALGGPGYAATLGTAALARLIWVVDGPRGIAYVRPWNSTPPSYQYNRLGAVFTPADSRAETLVARVLPATPAADAGIHDGDVLLKIYDFDATQWRTDPLLRPLSQFWERPAGTKLKLTLKRGNETLNITATLRDILSPPTTEPTKSVHE